MLKHVNSAYILILMLSLIVYPVLLSGCGGKGTKPTDAQIAMPSSVNGKAICITSPEGEPVEEFINGVDIGAASAGNFPGEFGITKETYLRWFDEISGMNVNTIRVYVGQMPEFYEALLEHNKKSEKPIYLYQGVYANEEMLEENGQIFDNKGEFTASFYKDIENAVDMIHGSCNIEKLPGNSGGEYTADISPWVIGWIIGIEWNADVVNASNETRPDMTSFKGTYVYTEDASPFEVFLAEAAETAIARDLEKYKSQRPLALTNWVTTDPLDHPGEPSPEMEDGATIDVEHIKSTDKYEAGFFASYHIYPYYPDFLTYESKYIKGGDADPYFEYLKDLASYHSIPLLVSEYGIPASRGIAHRNEVNGMSQGAADEKQQAEWLIKMNQDIKESGCAGGLIFTWQDEWFKRTWNTMDYEDPDRRPFWYNLQSPEECFGLLSFDPGEKETAVVLDGDSSEWKKDDVISENAGFKVSAKSDEAFLYLMIKGEDFDPEKDKVYVPLSVGSGMGSKGTDSLKFSDRSEYLIELDGKDNSTVMVDASYDAFMYSYSHSHDFYKKNPNQYKVDTGDYGNIWLALSRPLKIPETGKEVAFIHEDTGKLHYGTTDPESEEYYSIADICAGEDFVEIRLPWQLIGFMDPSTKLVMGDMFHSDTLNPVSTDGIKAGAGTGDTDEIKMGSYTWENWELPEYHERLKASYYILSDYFAD